MRPHRHRHTHKPTVLHRAYRAGSLVSAADRSTSVGDALIRGAIFRALYVKDYGKTDLMVGDEAPDYSGSVGDPSLAINATQLMLLDFAGCVIRKDAASVKKVLLAEAGSDAEKNAFTALAPAFGPCLPQHKTVQFSKASLGAVLSEAMYRIARNNMAGAKIPSGNM